MLDPSLSTLSSPRMLSYYMLCASMRFASEQTSAGSQCRASACKRSAGLTISPSDPETVPDLGMVQLEEATIDERMLALARGQKAALGAK